MVLPDVNVLVYAFRSDVPQHELHRGFLLGLVEGDEAFGPSGSVLSGFVRVVTHPRVLVTPDPIEDALAFTETLRSCERAVWIEPGTRH